MATSKLFTYDSKSKEEIIVSGVDSAEVTWFGFGPGKNTVHIVCDEGVLDDLGTGIKKITRSGKQITLTDEDAEVFYQANKSALDSVLSSALAVWAEKSEKTGSMVE